MAVHRDYAGGAEDHRAEGRVMQFAEDVAAGMLTTWLHMILAPYYIMTTLLPAARKRPESPPSRVAYRPATYYIMTTLLPPARKCPESSPPCVAHQPAPDLGPNVIRLAGSLRRH